MAGKKFLHPRDLPVGASYEWRGHSYTVADRDETLSPKGKLLKLTYAFEAACAYCDARFKQYKTPFDGLSKGCSKQECRQSAQSASTDALRKASSDRKGTHTTGGTVVWHDAPRIPVVGDIYDVRNGLPATVIRIDGPFQGKNPNMPPYYTHMLEVLCNKCGTPYERKVYFKAGTDEGRRWIRTFCDVCKPKKVMPWMKKENDLGKPTTEQKQELNPDDFPSVLQPPAIRPVAKRAEVINAVVEKAQMAPARPAPAVPVQPQKLPEYELAQAWQRLKDASERLNVQPKLGYLKSDHMEVRKILATRGPGLPALLNPLVQGVLAELDKLT